MTLLALSVLLALLAGAWVIQPVLVRRSAPLADPEPAMLANADARRSVALASLREVEYDREAGKLDEADYQLLRERLSAEALQAIQQADQLHTASLGAPHACGFVNPQGSRFCGGCGVRLA